VNRGPASAAGEHFAAARQRFEDTARSCSDQLHVREVDIAGARVRLRLVGHTLAEYLTETFAHLHGNHTSAPPALEIDAWSESETGAAAMPGVLRGASAFEATMDGGSVSISADEQFVAYRVGDNSVSWIDRAASRIVASVRRPEDLLLRERVKPFGALLPVWLRDRGVRVLHAAAVAEGGQALLLPGASGSGKSTCATFCVDAGLQYLGDDAVALEENGSGRFVVHSLYGGARMWPEAGRLLSGWSRDAIEPHSSGDEAKLLLFVGRRHRNRLVPQARVAAIAFPRVVGRGETCLRPLHAVAAVRALVATSLFLSFRPEASDMDQMLRLVRSLPAYSLELGSDRSQIAAVVRGCLRG